MFKADELQLAHPTSLFRSGVQVTMPPAELLQTRPRSAGVSQGRRISDPIA